MNASIIEYVKDNWDCITYARQVLGFPIYNEGDRCKSFRADAENPTSLQIFKNRWFDWGADKYGDVIDLCAQARHNGDISAALRELAGDKFHDIPAQWKEYTEKLEAKIYRWHLALRKEDRDYLHSRRITDETIERLYIGYDASRGRLTIPYWKNGRICYYVSRDRTGKKDANKYEKARKDEYNDHVPWGLHTLTNEFRKDIAKTSSPGKAHHRIQRDKILIVGEGMFDAMSFEQEGFCVLSPICGHFSKYQLETFFNAARHFERVFILFDSDGPGIEFQKNLSKLCFEQNINFVCGSLPEGIKDVSDYYADGGDLDSLVADARPGLQTLAQSYQPEEREEFQDFILQASRFVTRANLGEIIKCAAQFPDDWRKDLKADAIRPPCESLIVDEVKKEHNLKTTEGAGFFEYSRGVWTRTPDEIIKLHIKDALGRTFTTDSRMNSILGHLSAEVFTQEKFNAQNVFNFTNGILDLRTGELLAHSPAFMSSIQADYAYKPGEFAPLWDNFLNSAMELSERDKYDMNAQNWKKKKLLQQIAGYILFTDCSHEKAFMLIGEGSNGKSVFINTLINVFGESNCSNLGISDLASPFEPIRLQHSIVNFSTETKSNIKGTEDAFKKAVSGEYITAAYKGKDSITFKPRAKWIFAANNFITANDLSYGFMRRPVFVKFAHTFKGAEVDRNLTAKLRAELPGIFNWVYQGYLSLKESGEFINTAEQNALRQEFKENINPLEIFIREELADLVYCEKSSKELYELYSIWCKSGGYYPLNRNNCTRQLRDILPTIRPDVRIGRNNRGTTFIFHAPQQEQEGE